jgi:hypothetical protein
MTRQNAEQAILARAMAFLLVHEKGDCCATLISSCYCAPLFSVSGFTFSGARWNNLT